jgi:hypothetical protein
VTSPLKARISETEENLVARVNTFPLQRIHGRKNGGMLEAVFMLSVEDNVSRGEGV